MILPDHYAVLGIPHDANEIQIRKAYRTRALAVHPDKEPNPALKAERQEEFQRVQGAYEILSDADKRLKYDTKLRRQQDLAARMASMNFNPDYPPQMSPVYGPGGMRPPAPGSYNVQNAAPQPSRRQEASMRPPPPMQQSRSYPETRSYERSPDPSSGHWGPEPERMSKAKDRKKQAPRSESPRRDVHAKPTRRYTAGGGSGRPDDLPSRDRKKEEKRTYEKELKDREREKKRDKDRERSREQREREREREREWERDKRKLSRKQGDHPTDPIEAEIHVRSPRKKERSREDVTALNNSYIEAAKMAEQYIQEKNHRLSEEALDGQGPDTQIQFQEAQAYIQSTQKKARESEAGKSKSRTTERKSGRSADASRQYDHYAPPESPYVGYSEQRQSHANYNSGDFYEPTSVPHRDHYDTSSSRRRAEPFESTTSPRKPHLSRAQTIHQASSPSSPAKINRASTFDHFVSVGPYSRSSSRMDSNMMAYATQMYAGTPSIPTTGHYIHKDDYTGFNYLATNVARTKSFEPQDVQYADTWRVSDPHLSPPPRQSATQPWTH